MKKKSYTYFAFVFFILVSCQAFAQQQENITGILLDSKTNEPVVFANIRIKDKALGIITNVDGSFRIPLRYKEYGDSIEISSMGYQTKELPITDLKQDELNILTIDPSTIDLQEAVVKGKRKRNLSAKQIVQKAIDAIPRNLPTTSFSAIGYYRDYQFKNEEYINLNEGVLEVFDQGIDQLDDGTFEARLFHFALNRDFEEDSLARAAYNYDSMEKTIDKAHLNAYGGNEFRILRIHNAIRNYNVDSYDFIGTLKTDLIKNHDFVRGKDVSKDIEKLYAIKFSKVFPKYRAIGMIYISKLDFTIHKLEYTMYDEKKRGKTRIKNKDGRKQKVIFDITTDYQKIDNKMYLNYISFNNSFQTRRPPKFVLDSTVINAPMGYFLFCFNNPVDSISAAQPKNYDIIFKKREFEIEKVETFKDSVRVYPKLNAKTISNVMREIDVANTKENLNQDLIDVRVNNIKDVDGNLVNQPEIKDYQQFREFFIHRVKPNSRAPFDTLFMKKNGPIFENQPIVRPRDYNEYWMNTPLQQSID